jgi:hypothetical protein
MPMAARARLIYPGQPRPRWETLSRLRTRRHGVDDGHAHEAWHAFAAGRQADVALGELILVLVEAGVLTVDDGGNYRVARR